MSKTEILEKNWMTFLQWVKDHPVKPEQDGGWELQKYDPVEQDFWQWYLDTKMEKAPWEPSISLG